MYMDAVRKNLATCAHVVWGLKLVTTARKSHVTLFSRFQVRPLRVHGRTSQESADETRSVGTRTFRISIVEDFGGQMWSNRWTCGFSLGIVNLQSSFVI